MSVKQMMTVDEFMELPERPGKRLELVDGEVVEVPGPVILHMLIMKTLAKLLEAFVEERELGIVFPDGLPYVLSINPPTIRVPDVSFVVNSRMVGDDALRGFWPGAPDLAIEIVSPSDRAGELRVKVRQYLSAGSRMVWVFWPETRTVMVERSDGSIRELTEDDDLDGWDVLPGFRIRVGQVFDLALRRGSRPSPQ